MSTFSHFFVLAPKLGSRRTADATAHWRADGKELFYLALDGAMMAVSIDAADLVTAGVPQTLFPAGAISTSQVYAVTRDGQRFLVTTRMQNAAATPLTVVVNWTSTLQQ